MRRRPIEEQQWMEVTTPRAEESDMHSSEMRRQGIVSGKHHEARKPTHQNVKVMRR